MEIMDGGAFTAICENTEVNVSVEFCKYTLYKTLMGLNYIHSENIIYRDVKSDNVLCNEDGDIKFCDFDYAVMKTEENQTFTDKFGTFAWMAPELVAGGKAYDERVDIYSCGIFAIELAQGKPPWLEEHHTRILFNKVAKELPKIDKEWPAEFQDFIDCCTIKDPDQRWSIAKLLKHPFLEGADGMKEAWKTDFRKWRQD